MSINKINQNGNALEKSTTTQFSGKSSSISAKPELGTEGAVTVLSGQSSALGAAGSPFNAEKVAEIKEAISKGKFKVNSEAIAARVIESARELLGEK